MNRIILKYALLAIAALALLWGLNSAMSYVPFSPQWSAKRAEAKAERLEGQVSTLEREAAGNAEIGRAVETYHTREVIVREGTAQAINEARNAPDADTPLTDERAARLRAADRSLCQQAPALCPTPDAP